MRLWHSSLLPYLPKQQLVAQWRELNSIYKNQPKHILINYIYHYNKKELYIYSAMVIQEMLKRGYHINNFQNYQEYFKGIDFKVLEDYTPFKIAHNDTYLKICCWNLYEKYIRGQKGFSIEAYQFITNIISKQEGE